MGTSCQILRQGRPVQLETAVQRRGPEEVQQKKRERWLRQAAVQHARDASSARGTGAVAVLEQAWFLTEETGIGEFLRSGGGGCVGDRGDREVLERSLGSVWKGGAGSSSTSARHVERQFGGCPCPSTLFPPSKPRRRTSPRISVCCGRV